MRGKVVLPVDLSPRIRITPACAGKSCSSLSISYSTRDHPRVCGEKLHLQQGGRSNIGSPPRVRGKGGTRLYAKTKDRITPACAGKSKFFKWFISMTTDHPRVCGEKSTLPSASGCLLGSPPRVRGKVLSCSTSMPAMWITPACAGKRAWSLNDFGQV